MTVEGKNVTHEPLVDRKDILFPPLHIKIGLTKQFVRKRWGLFHIHQVKVSRLSEEKVKAGMMDHKLDSQ